jgi:hypothetical protein
MNRKSVVPPYENALIAEFDRAVHSSDWSDVRHMRTRREAALATFQLSIRLRRRIWDLSVADALSTCINWWMARYPGTSIVWIAVAPLSLEVVQALKIRPLESLGRIGELRACDGLLVSANVVVMYSATEPDAVVRVLSESAWVRRSGDAAADLSERFLHCYTAVHASARSPIRDVFMRLNLGSTVCAAASAIIKAVAMELDYAAGVRLDSEAVNGGVVLLRAIESSHECSECPDPNQRKQAYHRLATLLGLNALDGADVDGAVKWMRTSLRVADRSWPLPIFVDRRLATRLESLGLTAAADEFNDAWKSDPRFWSPDVT